MKTLMCNKCFGTGVITHRTNFGVWNELCYECGGSGRVDAYITNADMIRKMDDEDLAIVLEEWFGKGYFAGLEDETKDVYGAALEWLQQPAEVQNEM